MTGFIYASVVVVCIHVLYIMWNKCIAMVRVMGGGGVGGGCGEPGSIEGSGVTINSGSQGAKD